MRSQKFFTHYALRTTLHMEPWKTVKRQTILEYSSFLTVEAHTVVLPDGRQIDDWPWVITPDFVNIVAVTSNGSFLIFRQTKYAIEGTGLAPMGGYIEPDEAPLFAAQRELLEETGYQATDWQFLGSYPVDGNRGAGKAHFFLATDARPVTAVTPDDLEEQKLLLLSQEEVRQALIAGEFKALPWATAVALALTHITAVASETLVK